ncbi:MAG: aspartate/glutamate racemase family protein [Mobilitalea sp.]
MKTIGLIGGLSWESTVTYYQIINEVIREELGGFHSAKCIINSVDFAEIEECQTAGEWEKSGDILAKAAVSLEKAGADFVLIGANTMHKVAEQIQKQITIPIIHIAEVTAEKLLESKISKVALLGTRYTMTQDFYKSKLIEKGIEVLIPEEEGIQKVNHIIYNELCLGIIKEDSKKELLNIIEDLSKKGAQGAILGCTEIGLLVNQKDTTVPLFDTALIHAQKAAYYSIE